MTLLQAPVRGTGFVARAIRRSGHQRGWYDLRSGRGSKGFSGHRAYGIPHPGALLLDADGVVRGKFAIAGYKERPSFEVMLQAASKLVQK